jgi:hypothetical protein
MRRGLALAVVGAVAVVSAGAAGSSPPDVWKKLRRPLHIPRIAPGAPCPTTGAKRFEALPAFPVLAREGNRPVLHFNYPLPRGSIDYGSPWSAQKVMWVVRARYRGPLLIRGRQLDGPHDLRFEQGQIPPASRRIPAGSGVRRYPSTTRVSSPGCYAYQVDGLGFSRLVVFEAKVNSAGDINHITTALRARGLAMEPAGIYESLAFDQLGVSGHRFANPAGDVVLWQFPTFDKAQGVLIDRDGRSLTFPLPSGRLSVVISLDWGPDVMPHWYRSGSVIALYLGSDSAVLKAMRGLLGEQIAGA